MRFLGAFVAVFGLLLASCGSDSTDATADGPAATEGPESEPATTLRPGATAPPPTEVPQLSDIEARRFEVGDATV